VNYHEAKAYEARLTKRLTKGTSADYAKDKTNLARVKASLVHLKTEEDKKLAASMAEKRKEEDVGHEHFLSLVRWTLVPENFKAMLSRDYTGTFYVSPGGNRVEADTEEELKEKLNSLLTKS
jgi:hypothetical protein